MKPKQLYIFIPLLIILFAGYIFYTNPDVPKTDRVNITTHYFGKTVSDPYRWLEDKNSGKVKNWINEQNAYTEKILSSFPEGPVLAKRIKELAITSVRQFSPVLINDKLFFIQYTPPQQQPVVAYKKWPNGKVKILYDPNKDQSGTAVANFWPSPNGNYLAYGTEVGGTEAITIHIVDVKNGKQLPDTLPHAGGGTSPEGVVWDEGEKGLSYVHLPAPGTVPDSETQFNAVLYHHTLGKNFEDDKLAFGKGLSKIAEYAFQTSTGGKHAALFVHYGDGAPDYVYLRNGNEDWKQVLDIKANIHGDDSNTKSAWLIDNFLIISYEDAPRGKLLSISPDGKIKTFVTQGDWAMNAVSSIKGGFLITKVLGPDWKVDQYNNKGKLIRTVNLPKTGIGIRDIASSDRSDQVLIDYSGWTIPERWVQYETKSGNLKTVFQVKPAEANYSNVKVSRIDAISKDGTKVPVTVLSMNNVTQNGKNPSIVYGYGGFGICTAPRFIGSNLVWLEQGGILAYANIRGGGEFGEGWHEAGMLDKKQNCFDDMYAAAESLIKNNWTDSQHLGILGGSNGGLLMGAELTQHPDAFKAVVSFVGVYDMIRVELFPNGLYNTSEFGISTKEADFDWLNAYSPYHHVSQNTAYPATLLITGENDPRVAPWQSRKFAAALQWANNSNNPVLLLTRMNEGHGVTESFSQRVGNDAAQFTFFAHELGLKVK